MTDETKPAADLKGHEKAAQRKADGKQTVHEKAAEAEATRAHDDKVTDFLARYEHGLKHGASRTGAEFAELKALLGHDHDDDHHEAGPADKTG